MWPLPEGDLEAIIGAIEKKQFHRPEDATPRTLVELTTEGGIQARLLRWTGAGLEPVTE